MRKEPEIVPCTVHVEESLCIFMRMLITEDNLLIAYNTHTSLINSVTVYTRHASVSNLKVVEGKAWQDTSSYCFS